MLLNAILAILTGVCAWHSFKSGRNGVGWANLVASAFNAALFAVYFTRG